MGRFEHNSVMAVIFSGSLPGDLRDWRKWIQASVFNDRIKTGDPDDSADAPRMYCARYSRGCI